MWQKLNSILPGVPELSLSCFMDSTTQCSKNFSNSVFWDWTYQFSLDICYPSSVSVIWHQASKLQTLDSSHTPLSHLLVLSILPPKWIQLLPPFCSLHHTVVNESCLRCKSLLSFSFLESCEHPPAQRLTFKPLSMIQAQGPSHPSYTHQGSSARTPADHSRVYHVFLGNASTSLLYLTHHLE